MDILRLSKMRQIFIIFFFHFFFSLHHHLAVRHTSVKLVGELGDWVNHHPEHLPHILNWLLVSLQEPKLASQAADSLLNICSQCQSHMTPHFLGLVHILRSLDSFQLKPQAAIGLIKGAALLICNMPHERYVRILDICLWLIKMKNLLWYKLKAAGSAI